MSPDHSWFWKPWKRAAIVSFLCAHASDLLKSLYATEKLSGTWLVWRRTLDKIVVDTSYRSDYTSAHLTFLSSSYLRCQRPGARS